MQQSELWWRRATERLGVEAKLYVSQTEDGEPIEGGTWRDYFFRLWESRDRWQEPEGDAVEQARERFRKLTAGETVETPQEIENQKESRYSIKVCVRMRPRGESRHGLVGLSLDPGFGVAELSSLRVRLCLAGASSGGAGVRAYAVTTYGVARRTGNTFAAFKDGELLGSRRELVVLGLGLMCFASGLMPSEEASDEYSRLLREAVAMRSNL